MGPFFVAIESLLDPVLAAEIWPASLASNPVFLEQIKQRRELVKRLESVVISLPRADMPLEIAIDQGYVTEDQVADFYESLSLLLESGLDYMRLALYLPFEFLPKNGWRPLGKRLQQESDRFRLTYLNVWKRLLSLHDVRANFVDGDVLEPELRTGDLPRVVKAAHLIPKLVERGLLETQEVMTILEESEDQLLKESVVEALFVLADLGLLSENEFLPLSKASAKKVAEEPIVITPKRRAWLEQKKREETIEDRAEIVCSSILQKGEQAGKPAESEVMVEGIRKAVVAISKSDPDRARMIYSHYKDFLVGLRWDTDLALREAVIMAFRHFHRLGFVGKTELEKFGIIIPKLTSPFSDNLEFMEGEVRDVQDMVARVVMNPELSKLIYPVVLLYGSRLNGYGKEAADIDLSVLVRPGTSFAQRSGLRALLQATFAHDRVFGNEIIEFWLGEKEGNLSVRDLGSLDLSLGESNWMHILFGAVWLGQTKTIRELYERLLVPYMWDDSRRTCLEDMEQGTLQYRLMHKGYKRFFPPQGGIFTLHADGIDGQSTFWDSGYRQLATMLFASRVFLPKIPNLK